MKKTNIKKILKFSVLPIIIPSSLIPLALASKACGYDYTTMKNIPSKGHIVEFKNYQKIGKVFDQKVKGIVNLIEDPTSPVVRVEKEHTYWEWFSYVDAEIISITDGDTLKVKILTDPFSVDGSPNTKVVKGQEFKLRISSIDTLEEHKPNGGEVNEIEKNFAALDHKYAEKLIPVGSKVRLISDNWQNTSYNRLVTSLFFGENYERNFSCEMLAGGYTLPRIQDRRKQFQADYLTKGKKNSILTLLLPYLAYAYNEGIAEKRGFYSKTDPEVIKLKKHYNLKIDTVYELADLYKEHGDMAGQGEYILSPKYSTNPDNKTDNIFRFMKKNSR
ncbi:thermonuclease family protein [Metamycoplasma hyosynoviae]|uniref:Thermonuclease family protein n=1 Tax=Metamycoplasma hyosynoviae TaxID=29559 RepID=A0A9Q9BTP2_9BACT|nr:thermonuclease family protein [Metamycoplasma hyosynoviae]MDD1358500.1 thermonuclease family protein [Metamycoplasma hyosynoviae]MDD1361249.1 thermonuclease family protein [Metamycoplasma hyosynoviae]UTO26190.1 thermonuclease family protein [Metamycoplasma hyosynoviae]UTO26870.1 thermonuclease family protein [Metamycoplasma hyosynoviae]UTO27561.1 thermonuclease family protein [Metamycoplasma hyosynoviae]